MRLAQILDLVGTLDDGPGEKTARARFRQYLAESVTTPAAVRDYVQECLSTTGPQYNRALQDLMNHTGRLMGFEVEFGRYSGVQNEIGFDGIWRAQGFVVVLEVKTTDTYAIKTATLLNYINALVSERRVVSKDDTLGLYVVGRVDPELRQLENAIVAEKRIHELRVITVESVLSLAELVQEGQVSQDEAIGLIRPASVLVDKTVGLIARVAASAAGISGDVAGADLPDQRPAARTEPMRVRQEDGEARESVGRRAIHLLTPVSDNEQGTVRETLDQLLGAGWYVFGERTPGRKDLQPGDHICFYAATQGVVAEAEVESAPELGTVPGVRYPDRFPWRFRVRDVRFFENPVVIDGDLRSQLDAFKGRNPGYTWGWFVQGTRHLTDHDFRLLTRRSVL